MTEYRHPWDCKDCDHISADNVLDVTDTTLASFTRSWADTLAAMNAQQVRA